jgi:hypothetical protein
LAVALANVTPMRAGETAHNYRRSGISTQRCSNGTRPKAGRLSEALHWTRAAPRRKRSSSRKGGPGPIPVLKLAIPEPSAKIP